jgi:hypothetical protein
MAHISWHQTTGAALALFLVKLPATSAGSVEYIIDKSFFAFFIPEWTPEARKPLGAVITPILSTPEYNLKRNPL